MLDFLTLLRENPYPGRGILVSRDLVDYFIMGRSANSRNRVFVTTDDGIRTEAFDPAKLEDPSLIIYHPVRTMGEALVVTNGDQTDTICRFMRRLPQSFEATGPAHMSRTPRTLPRASPAILNADGCVQAVHPQVREGNPDAACASFSDYDAASCAGLGTLHQHLSGRRQSPAHLRRRAAAKSPSTDTRTSLPTCLGEPERGQQGVPFVRIDLETGEYADMYQQITWAD